MRVIFFWSGLFGTDFLDIRGSLSILGFKMKIIFWSGNGSLKK